MQVSGAIKKIEEKYSVKVVPDSDYLPATNGVLVYDSDGKYLFRVHGIISDPEQAIKLIEEELRGQENTNE